MRSILEKAGKATWGNGSLFKARHYKLNLSNVNRCYNLTRIGTMRPGWGSKKITMGHSYIYVSTDKWGE
jgi:hypothetical protein